ncbi:MAG: hypothetical protein A2319_01910 [Candidatus Kerfeldbacteria bacterium RIFOXYB2_FULL_38_14]|uniref:HicB-like antitoxin of toxin-antitoxin system domain-containing protein n=1 Tax=Candidatus Kerfeldbacteria bacterium RIFOXYB2_FULL_38_14 TaxID=1798547 RepID=A0A1G2BD29_9BACT|nr:MAG: hypothetical protein A2319_01910 [Candidatus Kerfeldbacteria bacterium RIFOXYB2_FULL_38_14]
MIYICTMIIKQEGKFYIAEALELGVVSQGKTIEEAKKNLTEAVELYLEDEKISSKKIKQKSAPFVSVLEVEYA